MVTICLAITLIFVFTSFNTKNYEYPTFEEIIENMDNIKESLSNIKNVSIVTVGYSVEDNPIKSIQISTISELKVNNTCDKSSI